jgi:hypothetical protein
MNNNTHPVELLLIGALVALEAAATLLVALLALALAVARYRPAQPAAAAPAEHPLAAIADSLIQLPQRELMAMAGTRRRLPKHQLTAQLLAMAC